VHVAKRTLSVSYIVKVWLFQDITHRDSAVRYGRFGLSYQSHVQGLWISGDAVG